MKKSTGLLRLEKQAIERRIKILERFQKAAEEHPDMATEEIDQLVADVYGYTVEAVREAREEANG